MSSSTVSLQPLKILPSRQQEVPAKTKPVSRLLHAEPNTAFYTMLHPSTIFSIATTFINLSLKILRCDTTEIGQVTSVS